MRPWSCRLQAFCVPLHKATRRTTRPGKSKTTAAVAPDGKVRDTKVLGGSPLLVQEAVVAVKKWKYEEAAKETVETVEVIFQ